MPVELPRGRAVGPGPFLLSSAASLQRRIQWLSSSRSASWQRRSTVSDRRVFSAMSMMQFRSCGHPGWVGHAQRRTAGTLSHTPAQSTRLCGLPTALEALAGKPISAAAKDPRAPAQGLGRHPGLPLVGRLSRTQSWSSPCSPGVVVCPVEQRGQRCSGDRPSLGLPSPKGHGVGMT